MTSPRWALPLLTALLVTALPSAATAQAPRPTPIAGAGSFNDAPLIEAGRYSDTVVTSESTYYAIEVAQGQQLGVVVKFDKSLLPQFGEPGFDASADAVSLYDVEIYTPLRQPADGDSDTEQGTKVDRAGFLADTALGYEQILDGTYSGDEFTGPGIWYIRVYNEDALALAETRLEVQTELTVILRGRPAESAPFEPVPAVEDPAETETETTTSTTTTADEVDPTTEDIEAEPEESGVSTTGVALFGGIALLVGAALGALIGRRRSAA